MAEIYRALTEGGVRQDRPDYIGTAVILSDKTFVGWRTKSATSPEPTIDMRSVTGGRLKIHVNTEGWDDE
ncbi:hypothetical protein [Streptoalloteichus tenebrarius]|uniref:hypothetical protein n=1 Tax=Streptoalloteichus tenebrarius (strain ATCC 17920 / DSM 40477 / JCM 4838 / CBS 697.72 / NBRC 16177 / NCIMB 11028 / NRRL B-12390 / A12253. 1 / ISP 5477) TaxID=1933 RepID=UPI0020A3661D|nr:hypothetical protein [Streptoalloteichus tenebrarius]